MVTKKIRLDNQADAVAILGVQDERLRQLEQELNVSIFVRHDEESGGVDITIRGSTSKADKAAARIKDYLASLGGSTLLRPKKNQHYDLQDIIKHNIVYSGGAGTKAVRPRTERQKTYVEAIFSSDLVISSGPAGTGKTFLAVACALRALEMNMVERIVLTRPIVEAGENLGFLPGDLYEKVNPYLKPLYDSFYSILGYEKFRSMREDELIEIIPLAYMRGRTLEDAFIILDEAQNTTREQIKMFLTRMGLNSRVVVTGDPTQIDLKDKRQSGLIHASHVLKNTGAITQITFNKEDVVRHQLVRDILLAYEIWERENEAQKGK